MGKNEILESIAKEQMVEKIIKNCATAMTINNEDLAQDIYVCLLNDDKVERLYSEGKLKFYVTRLVLNNLFSKTSRFYYHYIKWDNNKQEIKDKRELLCD